jgi:copper chaperone
MQSTTNHPTSPTQQVNLAIDGMSCGHCVAAVTEALAGLPGVEVRRVAVGAASVALDPQTTSTAALVDVVREAGYDARIADRPLPQAAGSSCCSPRPA